VLRRLATATKEARPPAVGALAGLAVFLAAPVATQGGVELTDAVDKIPLPSAALPVSLRVEPLASRVVLGSRDPAALAQQVRATSHPICPEVSLTGGEVVLRCRSRQIAAALVPYSAGLQLELRLLQVPPWSGRDGLPIVPFDPQHLDLGSHCPGDGNAARGECALASGHPEAAEAPFREALGGPHGDLAALRLGDLAARAGDLQAAVSMWRRVSLSSPYGRLAGARLCEIDARCLQSSRAAILFVPGTGTLRDDLVLRQARIDAFQGRALEAAQALAAERGPIGACSAEPTLCGDVLLAALREPGARGLQALALYLDTPSRDRGPLAVELARAASDVAAASGAPVFAANLLANTSGEVSAGLLPDHLARATELYLAGGDRVRAAVLLDFARSRLERSELAKPRWTRIARAVTARPSAQTGPAPETTGLDEELAAARKALSASRSHAGGETP